MADRNETPAREAQARFKALTQEALHWLFQSNPVMATMVGVHDYDGELGEFSEEAIAGQHAGARRLLEALHAIDASALPPDDRIDYELAEVQLESSEKVDAALRTWRKNPYYASVPMMGIYLLLFREFAPLEQRLESTLGRLRQIPRVLAEGERNLTEPVAVFVETALETARGGLGFFQGLVPMFIAQAPSETLRQALEEANGQAVEALQDHIGFLETLLPKAGPGFAVGRELFDYLLRRRHLLPYDAESLHAKGQELFAETLRQMEETARQIDPNRSLWEVVEDLKREHPEPGDLLETYRKHMAAARQWTMDHGIVDLPPGEKLVVEETPVFQRPVMPYAAYMPPAAFEADQTGHFLVTPVDTSLPAGQQERILRDHCLHKIPITAVHEAYPGHHTQLCWANRNPRDIRKLNDSTLFIEGWAFYLEELVEEMGFVSGPKYRLFRLKDQLWRAARIILDAGLHARGMTVDQAVDFLVENVRLERPNALAEVRRYTTSPTQPMSYLIGKLEIARLAADYKAAKGAAFDLRRFHNELLAQGNLPPAMHRRLLLS